MKDRVPTPFKKARLELNILGVTLGRTHFGNEYRVNFRGGQEATAYYTNDLDDAVGTARLMVKTRDVVHEYHDQKK